jgi:predicted amidohydrolase YtcJ
MGSRVKEAIRAALLYSFSWVAAASAAVAGPASADLALLHGRIHTMDPNHSVAQALAVRGNSIVFVGNDADAKVFIGPRTRIVDLRGHIVLPGLIDAHTHPAQAAARISENATCTIR